MAKLRIELGAAHAEITFADDVALTKLENYGDAYGGPDGTAQVRLTWFLRHLAGHIDEVSDGVELRRAVEAARTAKLEEQAGRRIQRLDNRGDGR